MQKGKKGKDGATEAILPEEVEGLYSKEDKGQLFHDLLNRAKDKHTLVLQEQVN